jgi:hypothetical protein
MIHLDPTPKIRVGMGGREQECRRAVHTRLRPTRPLQTWVNDGHKCRGRTAGVLISH